MIDTWRALQQATLDADVIYDLHVGLHFSGPLIKPTRSHLLISPCCQLVSFPLVAQCPEGDMRALYHTYIMACSQSPIRKIRVTRTYRHTPLYFCLPWSVGIPVSAHSAVKKNLHDCLGSSLGNRQTQPPLPFPVAPRVGNGRPLM
jgi:hypothetical protein